MTPSSPSSPTSSSKRVRRSSYGLVEILKLILCFLSASVHSRAEAALHETLTQPPAPRNEPASVFTSLLRDAQMESIALAADSPVAGKYIGELALRTATGASIVGIERSNENIVNPGLDEELRAEDRVLLLGTRAHLVAARALLTGRQEDDSILA